MTGTLLVALAAVTLTSAGTVHRTGQHHMALTIIIDTRWSCGNDMSEFRTLAQQGIGALRPGDCVELLTAHPNRPRIRLAQTAHLSTPAQADSASRALAGIRADFLANAQVARSLKMALDRLKATCAKQGYQRAVVIVLSDGHLRDSDAAGVLKLAQEFKKRNWPLHITGDRKTNRNLLIAASKSEIHWSSIAGANPALWLRQARAAPRPQAQPEQLDQETDQEKVASPRDASPRRSPLGESPLRTIRRPSYLAPDGPVTGIATSESTSPQDGITARSRTEVEVTFPSNPSPATAIESLETEVEKANVPEPNTAVDPNGEPTGTASIPADMNQPGGKTKQPPRTSPKSSYGRKLWLPIGLGFIPLAAVGYVIARGNRQAREVRGRLQGGIKTKATTDDGMLIAKINGQPHHLGKLSRLRTVHVGSGTNNTLRIAAKGVSDRHLRLYRKGARLMAQNLGKSPVTVDGLPLAPKAKRGIVLPSLIKLAEGIELRLSVHRPTDSTSVERRSHEQDTQK